MKRKWDEQKRTLADVLDETTEERDAVYRFWSRLSRGDPGLARCMPTPSCSW